MGHNFFEKLIHLFNRKHYLFESIMICLYEYKIQGMSILTQHMLTRYQLWCISQEIIGVYLVTFQVLSKVCKINCFVLEKKKKNLSRSMRWYQICFGYPHGGSNAQIWRCERYVEYIAMQIARGLMPYYLHIKTIVNPYVLYSLACFYIFN